MGVLIETDRFHAIGETGQPYVVIQYQGQPSTDSKISLELSDGRQVSSDEDDATLFIIVETGEKIWRVG